MSGEINSTRIVTTNSNNNYNYSIRLVVQRYRKASLLINEKEVVTVGREVSTITSQENDKDSTRSTSCLIGGTENDSSHIGMLVYVSFSKSALPQDVQKAARTILNLPIQTEGAWGDGSTTRSIIQVALETLKQKDTDKGKEATTNSPDADVSIMLVPQANIIAKVKKNGKSVQYRDQIDKQKGEDLYNLFVESIERLLIEEHEQNRRNRGGKTIASGTTASKNNNNTKASVDPSILPKEYFRYLQAQQDDLLYGSFDPTTGIPLTGADGMSLTKSATKRIKKLYDAHVKRHEKYISKLKQQKQKQSQSYQEETREREQDQAQSIDNAQDTTSPTATPAAKTPPPQKTQRLDSSFVKIVAGSFGKRQGLELFSNMGPFCHVIDI